MTIILDHYRIPETGIFEIRQTVTMNISAQTARRAVNRWLLLKISTQMGAKEPSLIVNQRTVWRVPVRFTAPHVGKVGIVGHVDVDVLTGELLRLDSCQREIEQKSCIVSVDTGELPYWSQTADHAIVVVGIDNITVIVQGRTQHSKIHVSPYLWAILTLPG